MVCLDKHLWVGTLRYNQLEFPGCRFLLSTIDSRHHQLDEWQTHRTLKEHFRIQAFGIQLEYVWSKYLPPKPSLSHRPSFHDEPSKNVEVTDSFFLENNHWWEHFSIPRSWKNNCKMFFFTTWSANHAFFGTFSSNTLLWHHVKKGRSFIHVSYEWVGILSDPYELCSIRIKLG